MNQSSKLGLVVLLATALAACDGPLMGIPGGALKGEEQPLPPPANSDQGNVLVLETRPSDPYSVNIGYVVLGRAYYIDPTAERTWYQHLAQNPNVRVRFADSEVVHPAQVEAVTDPALISKFEQDRMVLRITARP